MAQHSPGRRSPTGPVRKATPDDWVACYDRTGKLIGIASPGDITRVADGSDDQADAPDDAQGAAAGAEPLSKARLAAAHDTAEAASIAKSLDVAALAAFHLIRSTPQPPHRGRP